MTHLRLCNATMVGKTGLWKPWGLFSAMTREWCIFFSVDFNEINIDTSEPISTTTWPSENANGGALNWWKAEAEGPKMHQSWCSTGVAIVHCHHAQLEPRVHFSRKIFTRWLHGVKRKWAETFLLDFLDFWGLQIEQEKLESTICQKGTSLSTICKGKTCYSFNYLSLVHFFISWQRLGEVVRLPLQ